MVGEARVCWYVKTSLAMVQNTKKEVEVKAEVSAALPLPHTLFLSVGFYVCLCRVVLFRLPIIAVATVGQSGKGEHALSVAVVRLCGCGCGTHGTYSSFDPLDVTLAAPLPKTALRHPSFSIHVFQCRVSCVRNGRAPAGGDLQLVKRRFQRAAVHLCFLWRWRAVPHACSGPGGGGSTVVVVRWWNCSDGSAVLAVAAPYIQYNTFSRRELWQQGPVGTVSACTGMPGRSSDRACITIRMPCGALPLQFKTSPLTLYRYRYK